MRKFFVSVFLLSHLVYVDFVCIFRYTFSENNHN